MARPRKNRRGIVILVVLSLLVLFVLLVVTFAIVAGQYERAAISTARQELLGTQGAKDLERGLYPFLRDTQQPGSALRFGSLLRDIYGGDGFRGSLSPQILSNSPLNTLQLEVNQVIPSSNPPATTGAYNLTNGQFMDLVVDVDPDGADDNPATLDDNRVIVTTDGVDLTVSRATAIAAGNYNWTGLSAVPGYYNGCVLTITSGRARGISTRIVGYDFVNRGGLAYPYFRVLCLKADDGEVVALNDLADAGFVVNGRSFNGTGAGLESQSPATDRRITQIDRQWVQQTDSSTSGPKLDAYFTFGSGANSSSNGIPFALLPNAASLAVMPQLEVNRPLGAYVPSGYPLQISPNGPPLSTPGALFAMLNGGLDEPYDAADYQNMFLAAAYIDPNRSEPVIIPSLHRPALVFYFSNPSSSYAALWNSDDNFKRRVMLRPIEPNFTGSNPNFTPVLGPWDVDNDGDGIPDSIWVDIGLPVQTAPDGRKYKPLFAFLCRDMDGRLNVNAHGNPWDQVAIPPANVAGGTTASLPSGFGLGPAEIRLSDAITSPANLITLFDSRYGDASDNRPGVPMLFDPLARIKFFEEPENYFTGIGGLSSYGSPSDLRAQLAFGLDYYGQPVSETIADTESRGDSPYELNLVEANGTDWPYTVGELERLLRPRDLDADLLPDRLANVLGLGSGVGTNLLTTDSFDPPVPGMLPSGELRDSVESLFGRTHAATIMELVAARVYERIGNNPPAGFNLNRVLTDLLSPELVMGVRMDINRPFGNGRDAAAPNANGVVDEVYPLQPTANLEQSPEPVWRNTGRAEFANTIMRHTNGCDFTGDGNIDDWDGVWARQLYARHLYVLAMTLVEQESQTGNTGRPDVEVAEDMAQWAINVVDFRDADSIMTPFEYDADPFDGWDVDGVLTGPQESDTFRHVVWGCERPELLISETLAFHDRRTEDLTTDPTGKDTNDANNPDDDWDQRLRPRGALFIELFNPWTSPTTVRPSEFYAGGGVALGTKDKSTLTSPVWRMITVKQGGQTEDPDAIRDRVTPPGHGGTPPGHGGTPPGQGNKTLDANDIHAEIYFVNAATSPVVNPANNSQFGTSLPVPPILPGRYAVIGPKSIVSSGQFITPVGRRANLDPATDPNLETSLAGLEMNLTRRIVLAPGAGGNQVHVLSNGGAAGVPPQANDADILPAAAIVMDLPSDVNFSISEPLPPAGRYPSDPALFDNTLVEPTYVNVRDEPLDWARPDLGLADVQALMKNQTYRWGVIHLQRLANPLLPYDATTNPYRTIDSMRCDLTAFNGVAVASNEPPNGGGGGGGGGGFTEFVSVQRGDSQPNRELWPKEPIVVQDPQADRYQDPDPLQPHFFNYVLKGSLGYINHAYWNPEFTPPSVTPPPFQLASAGAYRGSPDISTGHPVFSWLTWNNRPYIGPHELLQVPTTSSFNLLRVYNLPATIPIDSPYVSDFGQYGHLKNFFQSRDSANVRALHLYRLLEYVHVPSRFVGTDTILNPTVFGNLNRVTNPPILNPSFLPPFNRISNFRDPGRVNLNTMFAAEIWAGINAGHPGAPSFTDIALSRGGYDNTAALLNPNLPTLFANPFRPPGTYDLVPISSLMPHYADTGGSRLPYVSASNEQDGDVETTLMRSRYKIESTTPNDIRRPLFEAGNNAVATDNRNSFFRYNLLHRLGNMTTTRSNVYAVWITVGYFAVEPNVDESTGQIVRDEFHLDGMRVAEEMGLDTGEVERHRGFYIIDRSIPVAFEPGQNHNVDKCITLRRYIE